MFSFARRLAVLTLLVVAALGASARAASSVVFRPCEVPERAPKLETYTGIAPLDTFYVDVQWEEPEGFVPVAPIGRPLHHSSRLQWTNGEMWPSLRQAHPGPLRFRFKVLAAKTDKVPAQNRWWATYSAEIEDVCTPPRVTTPAPTSSVILEGRRCALASAPLAASAPPLGCSDEPTSLKASVSIVSEHGCSKSTESTASLSEFALELRGHSARLAIETFDSTSFGPARGAFQKGQKDFTRNAVRWRRIYTGTVERSGGNLALQFAKQETSVDRRGGIIYSELKKSDVDQTVHCVASGVAVMPPIPEQPSSARQEPLCAEVLLCLGLVELAPLPGPALEALGPIAPRVLVDGHLPLRGPGIEIRAKNLDGRELTSFRQPR